MPFYVPQSERREQDQLKRLERLGDLLAGHGLRTRVYRHVRLRLFQNEYNPVRWREPVLSVHRPDPAPSPRLEITVSPGDTPSGVTPAGRRPRWAYHGDEQAVISFVRAVLNAWPDEPKSFNPPHPPNLTRPSHPQDPALTRRPRLGDADPAPLDRLGVRRRPSRPTLKRGQTCRDHP